MSIAERREITPRTSVGRPRLNADIDGLRELHLDLLESCLETPPS